MLPDTARPQAADSRLRGGALEWFENAGVSGEMRVQCLLAGVLVLALILELAQLAVVGKAGITVQRGLGLQAHENGHQRDADWQERQGGRHTPRPRHVQHPPVVPG